MDFIKLWYDDAMPMNISKDLGVMRTAAWMWIMYLASLVVVDMAIYANRPMMPIFWYHFVNVFPALVFLGFSYSDLFKKHPKKITLLMILIIAVAPILVNNLLGLKLPPAPLSNLEGMVLRQLPVMMLGLVLVA